MTQFPVPYFDLKEQFKQLESKWFEEIHSLGTNGNFILGAAISELEQKLAQYLGVAHVITVSSGTDALVLAMRALKVKPGDSVIVPNFGFYATPEAVSLVGARPVFVDIQFDDFNLDANQIEDNIDNSTTAILPVHLFGAPANMDDIREIGRRKGVAVIEDAAQSFGAKLADKFVGGLGDAGCFSFYPTKILGAYGDGGMVTTNDEEVASKTKLLRNHGIVGPNEHELIGYTSRLNTVQAKLIGLKLPTVDEAILRRQVIAQMYRNRLGDLDIDLPSSQNGSTHVYNIFTIRTSRRDHLVDSLLQQQVGHQIYYPKPLSEQPPYKSSQVKSDRFPQSIKACNEAISLPNYPEMPDSHVEKVCRVVRNALA